MKDDQHSEILKTTTVRNLDRISNLKLEQEIEALNKELVVLNKILEQFYQEKKIQEGQLGLLKQTRENINARLKAMRAQKDSEKTLDSVAHTEYSNLSENPVIKSEAASFEKMKFQIEVSERILLEPFLEIKNKIVNTSLKIQEKEKLINTLKEKKEIIAPTSDSKKQINKKINQKEYIEKIIRGESVESIHVEQPEELITKIKFSYLLIKQKELTPSFFQSNFFEELEKKFPGENRAQEKLQALAKHIKERKNSRSMKALGIVLDLEQKKHNPEIKKLEKSPSTVAASVDGDAKTEVHALETIEQDKKYFPLKDFINEFEKLDPKKILNNIDGFKKALELSYKTAETDFELGIILSREENRIKELLNEFLEKGVVLTDFARIQEIKAGIIFLDQKNRNFLDGFWNESRSILKSAVISFLNLESHSVLEQYRAISDIVPGLDRELIDYAKSILSEVQISKSDFTEIKKVNSVLKFLETILEEKEFLKIKSDFIDKKRLQFEDEVAFSGVNDQRIREWGDIFISDQDNLNEFLKACQINWVKRPLSKELGVEYKTVLSNEPSASLRKLDKKHRYAATLIKNGDYARADSVIAAITSFYPLKNYAFNAYYSDALNFLYQEAVNEATKTHKTDGNACLKLRIFSMSNFLNQPPFSDWEISKKIVNLSKNMDLYCEITKNVLLLCDGVKQGKIPKLSDDFFLLASMFCTYPEAMLFVSKEEVESMRWSFVNPQSNTPIDRHLTTIASRLWSVVSGRYNPNANNHFKNLLNSLFWLDNLEKDLYSFLSQDVIEPYKKFSTLKLENGLINCEFNNTNFPDSCLSGKTNSSTGNDVNYEKYLLLTQFQHQLLVVINHFSCLDFENPLTCERMNCYFDKLDRNLDFILSSLDLLKERGGNFARVIVNAKVRFTQLRDAYIINPQLNDAMPAPSYSRLSGSSFFQKTSQDSAHPLVLGM